MKNKDRHDIMNELRGEAFAELSDVVEWRRHLHAHPELSFQEKQSVGFISEVLRGEGIDFTPIAGTGILARIEGTGVRSHIEGMAGELGQAVVLRADIDALPIVEQTGLPFASLNGGVMHACGHDFHTAILLGALRILNRHRELFSGTVFGLFQPGEELNPGGASLVLKEEPFKEYDVRAFIGEHVEPMLPTGVFGFREGKYMASNDELYFTVRGRGGHAALRDKIKDPVLAAARLIEALHAIVSVNSVNGEAKSRPTEYPSIISIGKVEAGGATNIVPDNVYMEGTMRTFDERWRKELKDIIRSRAAEIAAESGVETETRISEGYPPVFNDSSLTKTAGQACAALFGSESVVELDPRPTSEDFGFYTQRYPSVYYRLGVGYMGDDFDNGRAGRLHTANFDPDEKALGYGVAQFVNIVMTLLGQ